MLGLNGIGIGIDIGIGVGIGIGIGIGTKPIRGAMLSQGSRK